jgi:hypothetical protein
MKFVKWLVRKSRPLTMGRQDDELNEFIEEVTDGAYTLPCCEVILNLVKQMQTWGDTRIKKIVQVLASAEQHRVFTSPRYVKPKTLDQLEEWMKEKPIPYMSKWTRPWKSH